MDCGYSLEPPRRLSSTNLLHGLSNKIEVVFYSIQFSSFTRQCLLGFAALLFAKVYLFILKCLMDTV